MICLKILSSRCDKITLFFKGFMVIGRSTGTRYFFAVMGMIVRDSACSILHPYHEIGIVGSPRCMVLSSCYDVLLMDGLYLYCRD